LRRALRRPAKCEACAFFAFRQPASDRPAGAVGARQGRREVTDPGPNATDKSDPNATDKPGDEPKDTKGTKLTKIDPNALKTLKQGTKFNPNLVNPKVMKVSVNPKRKLVTKTISKQKVASRVAVRPAMDCSMRRVGNKMQRVCVRRR